MVRGERLTLVCARCGEAFTRLKSQQVSATAYCSDACRAAAVGERRTRSMEERFWCYVQKTDRCWRWAGGINSQGYGLVSRPGHDGGKMLAHRYSYELAHGPIPAGLKVLHRCDTPRCVNPAHLSLGTQSDNMRDMWAKSRQGGQFAPGATCGEKNHKARLTAAQVADIRRRYAAGGVTQDALAAEYGVDRSAIGLIVRGKNWKHTVQL